MRELIKKLYVNNQKTFLNNYVRLNDFHNKGCDVPGSTSKQDCWFLYLLVLQFKPKCIFEGGTYVGSTAKFLAAAAKEYGGEVHTCDPVNKFLPAKEYEDTITFHNKGVKEMVREFSTKGKKIDMVFYDCDFQDHAHIMELLTLARDNKNFVFAAHDYTTPNGEITKGRHNIDAVWNVQKNRGGYKLYTPELKAYKYGHMHTYIEERDTVIQYGINGCTAAVLPNVELDEHKVNTPNWHLKDN